MDAAHRTGVYFKDPGSGVLYYRSDSAASHLSPADADLLDLGGIGILHVSGITAAISARRRPSSTAPSSALARRVCW